MNPIIVLSHFNRTIGPSVFYSYPKNMLSEKYSSEITNIMEQPHIESFFIHTIAKFSSMNYSFNIQSPIARGRRELLMVSVILEQQTSPENEQEVSSLLQEFSKSLESQEKIFMAFSRDDIHNFNEEDREIIIKSYSLVKLWVEELYWAVVEVTRERTEEEIIAVLMSKEHIYYTLQELSDGVVTLDELKVWFSKRFPDKNFDDMITILLNKQLIFINQIGRVEKYILLLKEVAIERIPPDSVIDYIDEVPELIDMLLSKVQEYFNKYDTKTEDELKKDAQILYQIIADPKNYNLLSKLREGLIQRDKLPQLVSQKTLSSLIESIELLKKHDIIEELSFNNERYIVLKSNIQITTQFPKYLRKKST